MNRVPSADELRKAFEVIKGVSLPKMPEVVMALQQEMGKSEPDLDEVAQIIGQDVALTGLLLKTINSAAFGMTRKIESIPQAVSLLGLEKLNNLVLSSALQQVLGEETAFHNSYWAGAKGNAVCAAKLAVSVFDLSSDTAYLAGLFQDAGALLLAEKFSVYEQIYPKAAAYPMRSEQLEHSKLGTSHTVVGYLLAKHWEIADPICLAIYHSHNQDLDELEDSALRALVACLQLSSNIVNNILYPNLEFTDDMAQLLAGAYMELALDSDALMDSMEELKEIIEMEMYAG